MSETEKYKSKKIYYKFMKRIIDISLSVIGVLLLTAVFLLIAAAIYIDSKGTIFFIHKRVGKYGVPINLYKFRTMVVDAEDLQKYLNAEQLNEFEKNYKLEKDPRITKVGQFLRKTHLDELPQIWNILKGDLSIVGPRPIVADELKKYGKNTEKFLSVTPGLTGYWQVNGKNVSYKTRIKMELYYIENCSYQLDKIIFIQTLKSILKSIF